MTTTLDRQVPPRLERPVRGRVLHRLVGVGFAAAAVGNAVAPTRRTAPGSLHTHGCLSSWLTELARS